MFVFGHNITVVVYPRDVYSDVYQNEVFVSRNKCRVPSTVDDKRLQKFDNITWALFYTGAEKGDGGGGLGFPLAPKLPLLYTASRCIKYCYC